MHNLKKLISNKFSELCQVVDTVGGHGVISVLEGGYSLSSPLTSHPTRGKVKKGPNYYSDLNNGIATSSNSAVVSTEEAKTRVSQTGEVNPHTTFAQRPGDGGLVKRLKNYFILSLILVT